MPTAHVNHKVRTASVRKVMRVMLLAGSWGSKRGGLRGLYAGRTRLHIEHSHPVPGGSSSVALWGALHCRRRLARGGSGKIVGGRVTAGHGPVRDPGSAPHHGLLVSTPAGALAAWASSPSGGHGGWPPSSAAGERDEMFLFFPAPVLIRDQGMARGDLDRGVDEWPTTMYSLRCPHRLGQPL